MTERMKLKSMPFWLWPNVLSLDAPLVAVSWVWLLKESLGVRFFEESAVWVLAAVVWCVYVLDRILDVWTGKKSPTDSHRHAFSWTFRFPLLVAVSAISSYSVYFTLFHLPVTMLTAGVAILALTVLYLGSICLKLCKIGFVQAIPSVIFALICGFYTIDKLHVVVEIGWAILCGLFMTLGVLRVCSYLSDIHVPYGKNLAASFIFALGVAIPARLYQFNDPSVILEAVYPLIDGDKNLFFRFFDVFYNSGVVIGRHIFAVLSTIETVTFGLLCMLNISAIDLWEEAKKSNDPADKATNEMILSTGLIGLLLVSILYIFLGATDEAKPYFYAIMAACAILHIVNRAGTKLSLDAQRVLADIALLTPIPFFYLFNTLI
jgi:hypothetical protein